MLHELGEHSAGWEQRIVISDDLRVFEKRFPFVESVSLSKTGVVVGLSPRFDHADISVRLQATSLASDVRHQFYNESIAARPPSKKNWWFKAEITTGAYLVEIWLESQVAYRNILNLGDAPF